MPVKAVKPSNTMMYPKVPIDQVIQLHKDVIQVRVDSRHNWEKPALITANTASTLTQPAQERSNPMGKFTVTVLKEDTVQSGL